MSEHIPEAATVKHAKVEVIAQDTRDRVQAAERPKVRVQRGPPFWGRGGHTIAHAVAQGRCPWPST